MSKREISAEKIELLVEELCTKANTEIREDVKDALDAAYSSEDEGSISEKMIKVLQDNAHVAKDEKLPLCQDTGMVGVFIEMGDDVVINDGGINEAVNLGVERAYRDNFFRKSVVADPLTRENTGTNTPAIIHIDMVEGDKIKISVMPKGFGSENKGQIKMFNPTAGRDEIVNFCVETVKAAGPDACPPYVLGIGIGGTMEYAAFMSKKSLLRQIDQSSPKPHVAEMEHLIKDGANVLNVGVMGLGGKVTVLGVNIETFPTHIAGLPVAVNICCHALRSATGVI